MTIGITTTNQLLLIAKANSIILTPETHQGQSLVACARITAIYIHDDDKHDWMKGCDIPLNPYLGQECSLFPPQAKSPLVQVLSAPVALKPSMIAENHQEPLAITLPPRNLRGSSL